jgi:DNA-3-methyladenine glycosylase I
MPAVAAARPVAVLAETRSRSAHPSMSPRPKGELVRCPWVSADPLYVEYHDREWGVPERDDRALFEKLILDGFQAGLSWITILRKRDAFRRAFAGFEPQKMARFSSRDVARLMGDAGIVRNRAKIEAAIGNARAWLTLQDDGGFARLCWAFVDGKPRVNRWDSMRQVPAESAESRALSKALVARGFRFVGPTIVYAWMQACGLVNDHLVDCFRHRALAGAARRRR